MSLYKLAPDRDLDRGPNSTGFSRVVTQEEARVRVQTLLNLVQSECKRSTRSGLDHVMLFDPRVSTALKANHINATILSAPGITDSELTYAIEPDVGRMRVLADITYDQADQQGRRSKREQFLIQQGQDTGGSSA